MNEGEWIKIGVGRVIHVSKIAYIAWYGDRIRIDIDNGESYYVEHGYEGSLVTILGPKPD